ncbi:MAG TPA: cystathionine beta-lyase [Sphingomicrobium sp.]|nr:cystathionine beta-lyase [Sphingomicrobium sp.]
MGNGDKHRDTRLAGAGRRREWAGRAINVPVHRSSTILFDDAEQLGKSTPGFGKFHYSLQGTPSQWSLAEALTGLEPGAAGTMLYPTGLAAITAGLLAVLSAGDDLLVPDTAYRPTRNFCDRQLKRWGITTRYYDPLIGAGIAAMIGERTKMILLESPGSLTMEVQDVPAICAVARERGVTTFLDNTWATPLLFPAIAAGVDMTMMALTKYVGGHSDLMLGSVTANEATFSKLQRATWDLGHFASPDDCFLALRGLRTMGIRLERHEENALKVAAWLKVQPQVARILHPAFPDCPGHDSWKRDFQGSSGLFSVVLTGGSKEDRNAVIDRLRLFGIGFSWGGYESLAADGDWEGKRTATRPAFEGPVMRLHIGLEDPDDLIADLARALADYPAG